MSQGNKDRQPRRSEPSRDPQKLVCPATAAAVWQHLDPARAEALLDISSTDATEMEPERWDGMS